ncbi:MAG TPA: hypothetical protein DEG06_10375 [Lachnospiraceae bacterium]|jgi:hypothetical protein|nr:hypothetical protein [Lachnospiraceae bacterium]HBY72632.1 hypothetical protein [Lachnospiraceae bacterium]HCA70101.1 hypothetical protein [Lachnospiraceae bacterium]HCM12399.1 hypothetical protein [Lachnospiraceae bacterium]HCR39780.1 hypothetical protein [Lachnospiraceae bacterium]
MGEIIIEETNYKAFALTMAYLFMLVAAISVAILGEIKNKKGYLLIGILTAVIFLIGFLWALAKASKIKSLLTITMDGIIDNSSIGAIGFISFDDIKEFKIVTLYNKNAIAVIPKNIDIFLSKLTTVKRRQVKRNIHLNLPPVAIMVDMAKNMEPEDILSLLQKRLSDYSRLYE